MVVYKGPNTMRCPAKHTETHTNGVVETIQCILTTTHVSATGHCDVPHNGWSKGVHTPQMIQWSDAHSEDKLSRKEQLRTHSQHVNALMSEIERLKEKVTELSYQNGQYARIISDQQSTIARLNGVERDLKIWKSEAKLYEQKWNDLSDKLLKLAEDHDE